MTLTAIQTRGIALRQKNPLGQFGQARSTCVYTAYGSYGCGHTCCQFVAELMGKGKYTHDQISKIARYPNMTQVPRQYRRGLSSTEAIRFLASLGIGYHVESGLTLAQLVEKAKLGPVFIVHQYRYWPEWKGYEYLGRVSDGIPNGYASPLGKAGANQVGLDLAHWGVFIGEDSYTTSTGGTGYVEYAWETNHRSASRPEPVPFDKMTRTQLRNVQTSRKGVLLVPNKAL